MTGYRAAVRLLVAGAVAAAISLVSVDSPAVASVEAVPYRVPEGSWQVNGPVFATAIIGDTVIVGGAFRTAISPTGAVVPRRNLAAFSMTTGALRMNWTADTVGTVRALEADGSFVYVGGSFTQVAGRARLRMAKVSVTSGRLDSGFRPRFNNTVRAIAVDRTSVYVGGKFTDVNGRTRWRLAKFSRRGALDGRFRPRVNNVVWGLAKARSSSTVYVAGPFSKVNRAWRNGVGAVRSTTGATTGPAFARATKPTLGLAVNATGSRLYGAGGSGANTASAWSTRSGTRLWRVAAMGDIQAIEYYRGRVYFGFHDGFRGNKRIKMLAASAFTGALDRNFRPRFDGFWGVKAISVSRLGVVAGGDFNTVDGEQVRGWVRFRP
ncbi:hypothetical protein [Nocardioides sp. Soil796]|uniref:hypothetical protein n=1 Tax=Nocardioides sp. Soil796 TaxID=1736412 RepID=UPI00070CF720|nr:hypothetical protein [Nocardioides sp. Soil796]KRF12677.1 hypothetical protein ASH02_14110 [Nocardioides sp. Soil796]